MRNTGWVIQPKQELTTSLGLAKDYLELGKPRVVLVMLVCAAVGMALAVPGMPDMLRAITGLVGIGLAAMGAAAFNHLLDRRLDKLMLRTSRRPVAEGRIRDWPFRYTGC